MPDLAYRNLAASVLVAHQRHRGGCLCGWHELGKSHAEHVAEVLDVAGALRVPARAPARGGDAELSKLLFEAREQLDMWADIVEVKSGVPARYPREVVARIDAYRAERGWSPDGFGGEGGS